MVQEEDPATGGSTVGGNTNSPEDPHLGEVDQGTEAKHEEEDITTMNIDGPVQ